MREFLKQSLADAPDGDERAERRHSTIVAKGMAEAAELDLPTLPLWGLNDDGHCRCSEGEDCPSAGKHPITFLVRRGVKNAACDAPEHKRWLKRFRAMNFGVALPGYTVVDCDSVEAYRDFKQRSALPRTRIVKTRRGYHIYFRGETRNRTGIIAEVDIKSGPDAYVVGPGSRHRDGGRYKLAKNSPIAKLPTKVCDFIMAGNATECVPAASLGDVSQLNAKAIMRRYRRPIGLEAGSLMMARRVMRGDR